MFVQATIQCECGCISRSELQGGRHSYVCPKCGKTMNHDTYNRLETIMGQLADLGIDTLKYASQYDEPNMRAIAITVADFEGPNDPNGAFQV